MKSLARVLEYKSRRQRERDAYMEQLLAQHGEALRLFLRFKVANPAEREDVLQDVCLRLLQQEERLPQLRAETVRSYLFTIASNLLKDRYRRALVRRESDHMPFDEAPEPLASQEPEQDFIEVRTLQQLEALLVRMPAAQRRAFLLHRIQGASYREISEQMDVSVSSVEKYIAAALVWLRGELQ